MAKFRINFNNGQVSESFGSRAAVNTALVEMSGEQYALEYWIQFRDESDGEWFACPGGNLRATVMARRVREKNGGSLSPEEHAAWMREEGFAS